MRCPKCHYVGFEPEPRCRHCGYDLALANDDLLLRPAGAPPDDPETGDLELRRQGDPGTMEPGEVPVAGTAVSQPEAPRRVMGFEGPRRVRRPRVAPSTTADMPLFVKSEDDAAAGSAESRVHVQARPRRPLGVRRAENTPRRPLGNRTPEALGPLEKDLLDDFRRLEARVSTQARAESRQARAHAAGDVPSVTVGRRLAAATLDALLMGSIGAVVFGATLRVCDLNVGQAGNLPVVPFAVFLLIVAIGYLLMFTLASGQTVGKMLMGLRVVGAASDGMPDSGMTSRQATLRALLVVPSVLPFGAGFLPAMIGGHRAVHDRLSHTRVVSV